MNNIINKIRKLSVLALAGVLMAAPSAYGAIDYRNMTVAEDIADRIARSEHSIRYDEYRLKAVAKMRQCQTCCCNRDGIYHEHSIEVHHNDAWRTESVKSSAVHSLKYLLDEKEKQIREGIERTRASLKNHEERNTVARNCKDGEDPEKLLEEARERIRMRGKIKLVVPLSEKEIAEQKRKEEAKLRADERRFKAQDKRRLIDIERQNRKANKEPRTRDRKSRK